MSKGKLSPKKLGALVSFKKGKRVETTDRKKGHSFLPYIGAASFGGKYEGYGLPIDAIIAKPDDVLMLWDGERSGLVSIGHNGIVSSTVARLTPKEGIYPKYLFYHLLNSYNWIQSNRTGTGVPHVPQDLPEKLILKIHDDLLEQKKIAEILTSADRVIELTSMEIDKLKDLKKGLMKILISDCLDNWPRVRLSELLTSPPRNGYSPVENDKHTGQFVLGLGCLTVDGYEPKSLKSIDIENDRLGQFLLSDGDFLISRSNTREFVGLCGIYKKTKGKVIYPDLMVRLKFNDYKVDKNFILKIFQTPQMRKVISSSAQGTSESMVKINSGIISNLWVSLPSLEEQKKTASIFLAIEALIEDKINKLSTTVLLKKGLMNDLLIGKVRVNC